MKKEIPRNSHSSRRRSSLPGSRPLNAWNNQPSLLNKSLPARPRRNGDAFKPQPPALTTRGRRLSPRRIFLTLLLILVLGGIFYGSNLIGDIDKALHGNIFSDIEAFLHPVRLSGENVGRVNILLAGYNPGADESSATDSIMIVSINTKTEQAFLFSIPRDLWVKVPGVGHEKINAANDVSSFNQSGYFPGGMGELQSIIQNNLGINLNYYALINYTAFKNAVNAVGGITINIKSPDPRGLYDPNVDKAHGGPVRLANGPITLNGTSALALALARGDSAYSYGFPLSDINRTEHQRQMLIALVDKAKSAGVLANPVSVSNLVSAIGNNVQTDFSLADILRLNQITKNLNLNTIKSYGLSYSGNNPLLQNYSAPDGESALIPTAGIDDFSQIQTFYNQLAPTTSP